jgi:hypothetical protein
LEVAMPDAVSRKVLSLSGDFLLNSHQIDKTLKGVPAIRQLSVSNTLNASIENERKKIF